jgi:hypothetical protein
LDVAFFRKNRDFPFCAILYVEHFIAIWQSNHLESLARCSFFQRPISVMNCGKGDMIQQYHM